MDTWTVVLAVTGFLAGHYALRLVLEPAVEARKQVVGVRTTYDFYRNVAMNPPAPGTSLRPDQLQASEALRRAAGELRAVAHPSCSMTGYGVLSTCHLAIIWSRWPGI